MRLRVALAVFFLAFNPLDAAAEFGPKELVRRIASHAGHEVAFEEKRYLTTLTAPLASRGRLVYEPPDRLIKKVEEPTQETAIVQGDRLTLLDSDSHEVATFDLSGRPGQRLIFDAFVALLSGDADHLFERFDGVLRGSDRQWQLTLTPRELESRADLDRIVIVGEESYVQTVEIQNGDGDRSIVTLFRSGDPK